VPILTLDGDQVAAWASLVTGTGTTPTSGFLLTSTPEASIPIPDEDEQPADNLSPEHLLTSTPGAEPNEQVHEEDEQSTDNISPEQLVDDFRPEQLVDDFREYASPEAFRLAQFLAAAPLSLPVIRLVQRTMMPKARQGHIAEVFLSGLLRRRTPAENAVHPEYVWYDFLAGVREVLRQGLSLYEDALVMERVTEYVRKYYGMPQDFQALLFDSDAMDELALNPDMLPFAEVFTGLQERVGRKKYRNTAQSKEVGMFVLEWLLKLGFTGNPFATKAADTEEERELLTRFFVGHPAFSALVDESTSHNSVLHAMRGAGKSAACLMLEEGYLEQKNRLHPLIVHLKDWLPFLQYIEEPTHTRIDNYIRELLRHIAVALGNMCQESWVQLPIPQPGQGYLVWLVATYGDYLTEEQRTNLVHVGLLPVASELVAEASTHLSSLPGHRTIQTIINALKQAGFGQCYVFVDGIDEIEISMHSAEGGAALLAPLISNQQLLEMPGIAYKFFLPSEVITVLRQQRLLRADRVRMHELRWDDDMGENLLREMLSSRLSAFSNNHISSLDVLAARELQGTLDSVIISASNGSPRVLLLLGDLLFQECATDPHTNDKLVLIQPRHLDAVRRKLPDILATVDLTLAPPLESAAPPSAPRSPAIPPLSIEADGSICRGGKPIDGWQKLTKRQRHILNYLYKRADMLCTTEQLMQEVWGDPYNESQDKPGAYLVSEDAVRKTMIRLSKIIEPDPKNPCYIERVRGVGYCLRNTIHTVEPL
jgi:DNA-binding winged helix-turn-helix (wHTH) protein